MSSRFSRKAFAKVRRFFFPSKFFRSFFEKFFRRTSRGLSVSRSLAVLQGKILGCSAFSKSASLYHSVILSGSPSRKRLQRYALFPVLQLLRNTFLRKFWRIFVNRCKQDGCMWAFFDAFKNGRKQPYIMYFARACVRAHACTRTDKQEEACTHKGIAAVHTKKTDWRTVLDQKKQPKHGKICLYSGCIFWKTGVKNTCFVQRTYSFTREIAWKKKTWEEIKKT